MESVVGQEREQEELGGRGCKGSVLKKTTEKGTLGSVVET